MPKVMIADDSLFVRSRLAKQLTEHGYETVLASDGVEAVRAYRETQPDAAQERLGSPV